MANPIVALDRVLNALPNVASGPMTALIAQAFAADALSGGGGAAAKGNLSGTAGSKWRVHDNADDLRLMHSLLASALEIAQYPLCDCFGERAELQDITGDAQSQHSPIVFNLQSVNRSSAALRRLRLRGLNDATPEQFGRLIDATRPDLLCAADLQGRLTVGHMAQLAVAPDLLELDLANTEVEAAPAGGFATLRRVNLSGSSLGPGGVEAFRRAAPDAEVFFDYESR